MVLDVAKQLSFYAAYHNDKVNQWIHIICIPQILWTSMVMVSGVKIPAEPLGVSELALPWIVALVYGTFYLLLDVPMGLVYAPILAGMAHTSILFGESDENAFAAALVLHVVAWVAQFIGHGVFEGRAPALFTSLLQSLLLAPLFVGMELLFMLGFRQDTYRKVQALVEKDIAQFRASQKAKAL